MQHVIFARDRRRKKNRLKAFIFLLALLCIFMGIVLTLKNQSSGSVNSIPINVSTEQSKNVIEQDTLISENQPSVTVDSHQDETKEKTTTLETTPVVANLADEIAGELTYIDIDEAKSEEDAKSSSEPVDENATSYEDELSDVDDEVESAETPQKPEEKLPEEAENILEDVLDVAEQAIRIQNQFSYTVTRGDHLKDVLEQSGLGSATAKALEKKFPQLANLQAGQQFYWILGDDGELEYMNWLISEKEEKIFERKGKNQFAVQTIEKTRYLETRCGERLD